MKKAKPLMLPVICMVATLFIFRTVLFIGYVPTASMEPTVKQGSYILGLRAYGELKTGDIIVFKHDGHLLIKRIAASPGETIEKAGTVITVPAGCYYVLGDNAENSYDSRFWDNPLVKKQDILTKLI